MEDQYACRRARLRLWTPLANGASINLQYLLGIQQTGNFKFYINVEALLAASTKAREKASKLKKGEGQVPSPSFLASSDNQRLRLRVYRYDSRVEQLLNHSERVRLAERADRQNRIHVQLAINPGKHKTFLRLEALVLQFV